jgi:uncharacterized protein YjbI with pentapeptide repeats
MLLFACAPVTINQFLSDGQKPLTQRQLQVLISNQSIHLEAIDFDAQVHYLPNGHLTATNRQGVKDSGKWNISSESRLCMKFSQWYYGDLKCYQVFNDKDNYVFFTTNGARYYTATMPGGNGYDAANHSRNEISNHEAQSRDAPAVLSESNSTRTTVFLSEAEKRRALFNLARNCPDCNFAGVDLRGAELIAANMAGANLAGADLREANLRRANLSGANLSGANLAGSNLAGADLSNCDLSDADLTGSNLIRATVTGAKLDGSVLDGAHLESIQGLKD